jgi:hypothetical protein
MDKGNAGLSTIDTVPDVRGLLGSWDEVSMQISEQSTALSRDALSAALRLFEQSVSDAGEWMQTLGQGTRRLGELAQATERRIGAAEDVAGVWNLELGLLGQSAQMAAAFGQDAWLVLARAQTGMLQSALAQGAQSFERVAYAVNGMSPDVEEAAVAVPDEPIVPFVHFEPAQWPAPWQTQWPAVAESMSQGMQALWQAMAAAGAAATQAPADAAAAGAPPSRPRQASTSRKPGKASPRARSR